MSCISWIDHVACSRSIDNVVSNVQVLYEYVLSDHKPLSITSDNALEINYNIQLNADRVKITRQCWDGIDDLTKFRYASDVDSLLQNVSIPSDVCVCVFGFRL